MIPLRTFMSIEVGLSRSTVPAHFIMRQVPTHAARHAVRSSGAFTDELWPSLQQQRGQIFSELRGDRHGVSANASKKKRPSSSAF
jgi:hypothetical protein